MYMYTCMCSLHVYSHCILLISEVPANSNHRLGRGGGGGGGGKPNHIDMVVNQ